MDQQNNNDYEVYTVQNIRYALAHSTIPGVLTLVRDEPMHVYASEWKECLICISELYRIKWITKHKTNGNGTRIIYSESFNCHRAGSYIPWREVRTGQKDTKKCGCLARLKITIQSNKPDECEIKKVHEHIKDNGETAHIPGTLEDKSTLSLSRETISAIQQQLNDGRNCCDIRMSLLGQFESISNSRSYGSNAGQRKVNYEDVYNMMIKVCFYAL